MAQIDVREVTSQIKKGDIKNLYYFFGRNVSGVESLTRLLIKQTVGDMEDFALTKINGKDIHIPSFCDTIEMLPMMCEYNCVLINDYNCDEMREDITKSLIETLKKIPQQTVVIFNVTGFDLKNGKKTITGKNKKLVDFAAKNGIVCEQELKTPAELAKTIVGSVSKRGCEISIGTAQKLASMCLSNPLMISNEVEKLCAYANGGVITSEMLELMVAHQDDTTVYSLANAIASFNKISAFEALDNLLAQKVNRGSILSAVSSAFIDLYRASAAKKSGRTIGNMTNDFGYVREFVVKNAFRDCSRMSIQKLRSCIQILRETAVTLNSSGADEKVVLEQAVTKMLMLKN